METTLKSGDAAETLGRYIMSMPHRSARGKAIDVVTRFIESGVALTKEGYRTYCREIAGKLGEGHRRSIREFLSFAGVEFPAPKPRVVTEAPVPAALDDEALRKVNDFIVWCRDQRDYAQNSISLKDYQMRHFFRCHVDFTPENARAFVEGLERRRFSPATVNLYIVTLKQYGEYSRNPVRLRRVETQRRFSVENVPTATEYGFFLESLRRGGEWTVYWTVKILGCTGMRKSELFQARWADVLNGVFYPRCKGRKHRMVFFPGQLVKEAGDWIAESGVPPERPVCFSERTGGTVTFRGLDENLKRAAERHGFPRDKAHCHAFRHFFAKQYLARTKDIVELAELLGHSSVDTTRIYLQKSREEQRMDIDRNIDWV